MTLYFSGCEDTRHPVRDSTYVINGDFELGCLWPFQPACQVDSNICLEADTSIVRTGKYCAKFTIPHPSRGNCCGAPVDTDRIRSELTYWAFPSTGVPFTSSWARSSNGMDGTETWYAWSFMLSQLPSFTTTASRDSFVLHVGQLHTPHDVRKDGKQVQSSPAISLALRFDTSTSSWRVWTFQRFFMDKDRFGSRSPIPVEAGTWYDVKLRVRWVASPGIISYAQFADREKFLGIGRYAGEPRGEVEALVRKSGENQYLRFMEMHGTPYTFVRCISICCTTACDTAKYSSSGKTCRACNEVYRDATCRTCTERSIAVAFDMFDGRDDGIVRGGFTRHCLQAERAACYLKFGMYGGTPLVRGITNASLAVYYDNVGAYPGRGPTATPGGGTP